MAHKRVIAAFVSMLLFGSSRSYSETWQTLMDQADSLSAMKNQDSAIIIGNLALRKISEETGGEDSAAASVHHRLGVYQLTKGNYGEATREFEAAIRIREKTLGPYHPELAKSLHSLGVLYFRQGKYTESEPLFRRALEIRERALGPDNLEIAASLNSLGALYRQQGRYSEAEPFFTKALEIRESALGPDNLDVAASLNSLGALYRQQGKYSEAEPLFRRALEIRERVLGPDNLDVAASLNSLGILYLSQAKYSMAEPILWRALGIREKALGPDHPDVAATLGNLGNLYTDQGNYAEAEPLYRRALLIFEKAPGPNYRDVAASLDNLGMLYGEQGRYVEAESVYRRALGIRERELGPIHAEVAQSLNNLAGLYANRGEYAGAGPLFQRALEIREEALGTGHPEVATCLYNLGSLNRDQGNNEEAEHLYRKALEIWKNALGSDYPDVAKCLNELAGLHTYGGDYAEAEQLYGEALRITENALGPNHPNVAEILEGYSQLSVLRALPLKGTARALRAFQIRLVNFRQNGPVLSDKNALTYAGALRGSADNLISCYFASSLADSSVLTRTCDAILNASALVTDGLLERHRVIAAEHDSTTLTLAESLRNARLRVSQFYNFGPGADTSNAYRRQLDSFVVLADSLDSELSRHSASFQKLKDQQSISASRLRLLLPTGAVLLQYMRYEFHQLKPDVTNPHYLAVVLAPGTEPIIEELGEAVEIDSLVTAYRAHLLNMCNQGHLPTEADNAKYNDLARSIYDHVVSPVESHLVDKDLVFVAPDGTLNLVPFGGLIGKDGEYLIEKRPIHYLSSGRDLIRLKDRGVSGRGLLAMGDPDFDASAEARLGQRERSTQPKPLHSSVDVKPYDGLRSIRSGCEGLSELKVDRLPYSRTEVEDVASIWGGVRADSAFVYLDMRATEDAFKDLAPGRRMIHLATHGYFLEGKCAPEGKLRRGLGFDQDFVGENPLLLSGLLFAGSNLHGQNCDSVGLEDGVLSAYEVSGMDLTGTDLVVLSACETGLGKVETGEGVNGLRRAFQLVGVRSVVSALWSVPDKATSDMMRELYRQSDRPLYERMRDVQLTQIKALRAKHLSDHPYSWAGFVVSGDWR